MVWRSGIIQSITRSLFMQGRAGVVDLAEEVGLDHPPIDFGRNILEATVDHDADVVDPDVYPPELLDAPAGQLPHGPLVGYIRGDDERLPAKLLALAGDLPQDLFAPCGQHHARRARRTAARWPDRSHSRHRSRLRPNPLSPAARFALRSFLYALCPSRCASGLSDLDFSPVGVAGVRTDTKWWRRPREWPERCTGTAPFGSIPLVLTFPCVRG